VAKGTKKTAQFAEDQHRAREEKKAVSKPPGRTESEKKGLQMQSDGRLCSIRVCTHNAQRDTGYTSQSNISQPDSSPNRLEILSTSPTEPKNLSCE